MYIYVSVHLSTATNSKLCTSMSAYTSTATNSKVCTSMAAYTSLHWPTVNYVHLCQCSTNMFHVPAYLQNNLKYIIIYVWITVYTFLQWQSVCHICQFVSFSTVTTVYIIYIYMCVFYKDHLHRSVKILNATYQLIQLNNLFCCKGWILRADFTHGRSSFSSTQIACWKNNKL